MSSATGDYLTRPAVVRPVGLIAGIAVLEALTYAIDYSAPGGLGANFAWMLLTAYLLRKLWNGSSAAWSALVMLNAGVIVLCAVTLFAHKVHVDGGPWVAVRIGLELALLVAPGMRRWVRPLPRG